MNTVVQPALAGEPPVAPVRVMSIPSVAWWVELEADADATSCATP